MALCDHGRCRNLSEAYRTGPSSVPRGPHLCPSTYYGEVTVRLHPSPPLDQGKRMFSVKGQVVNAPGSRAHPALVASIELMPVYTAVPTDQTPGNRHGCGPIRHTVGLIPPPPGGAPALDFDLWDWPFQSVCPTTRSPAQYLAHRRCLIKGLEWMCDQEGCPEGAREPCGCPADPSLRLWSRGCLRLPGPACAWASASAAPRLLPEGTSRQGEWPGLSCWPRLLARCVGKGRVQSGPSLRVREIVPQLPGPRRRGNPAEPRPIRCNAWAQGPTREGPGGWQPPGGWGHSRSWKAPASCQGTSASLPFQGCVCRLPGAAPGPQA